MANLKILFADDQIPEDDIPNEEITRVIKERYPEKTPGFINAFPIMRETVNMIKGAGYDVTVARKYKFRIIALI